VFHVKDQAYEIKELPRNVRCMVSSDRNSPMSTTYVLHLILSNTALVEEVTTAFGRITL
jgi:hypothetical protein